MTVTISRLFRDHTAASDAVRRLELAGVEREDISIVSSNADNWYSGNTTDHDRDRDGTDDRAEGAGVGAGIGATLGGAAGLLAGLGIMAIPGIGPVVAAGWLATTALGAVAGGAAGGAVGALTQAGVSEEHAPVYAEGLRRGGAMVTARVPDGDRDRVEAVLDESAIDVESRAAAYREKGWTGFDEAATPYTSEQARRERDLYVTRGSGI